MAEIICKNLNKKYGDQEVVADFNLSVADHEFIVFLGPSGCGKSTILRMIAGLEPISGGDLLIGAKRVNDLEPRDRGIAMVFQNYALYPHMTIYDNIAFGLRRLKVSEADIETRVSSVVNILGLTPYVKRKPTELSGGQQQRVAIARAMIKTPEVFLFDEPLSNLDAKLRATMRFEIARLHKKLRTTSIYVTHDQMEAMTLADRIVLLNGGHIEQVGTPQEIYERPSSLFVAGFIGTPAMNLLPMQVQKSGASWNLSAAGINFNLTGKAFNLSQGQSVVLGLRPSNLLPASPQAKSNLITGQVDIVEYHGDQNLISFPLGDARFSALLPTSLNAKDGSKVQLTFDETSIHLFDATSGQSLLRAGVA